MRAAQYVCERCGTDDVLYTQFMLADALWQASGFKQFGCLRCLRQQLDRPLVEADFRGYLYLAINVSVVARAAVEDANTYEAAVFRAELLAASLALFAKKQCPNCKQTVHTVYMRRVSNNNSNEKENWLMCCYRCYEEFIDN